MAVQDRNRAGVPDYSKNQRASARLFSTQSHLSAVPGTPTRKNLIYAGVGSQVR